MNKVRGTRSQPFEKLGALRECVALELQKAIDAEILLLGLMRAQGFQHRYHPLFGRTREFAQLLGDARPGLFDLGALPGELPLERGRLAPQPDQHGLGNAR